ncbi:acyl-CoA N-acyltransferase [Aspergillus ambiguus]|uniref:GNAT family N-acetyltransferase n=1 Tax=Aspergillus ambiguus TaxID=176160 RepID=UPI003CCE0E8B
METEPTNPSFTIIPAATPAHIAAARALFTAYTDWLNLDLTFQNFASELQSLPGQYGAPHGALLLAYSTRPDSAGQALGCIAVRPLPAAKPGSGSAPAGVASECCEMKRLFVAPEARGMRLGEALVRAVVRSARELGYREMRLDTLPMMQGAIALYRRVGFVEIPPYYETPLEGTLFLSLRL